jgi:hypothetical protein
VLIWPRAKWNKFPELGAVRENLYDRGDGKVISWRSREYSQYHSDFMLNLRNLASRRWMSMTHAYFHFSKIFDRNFYLAA